MFTAPASTRPPSPVARASAFTLLEMLLVITIAGVLMAVSGAAISASLQSQNLAGTARQLAADLEHAALLARTENRPIEVLFFRYTPADQPGEAGFRAYQFGILEGFDPQGAPRYKFLIEPKKFPSGVLISPNPVFSTLLTQTPRPLPAGINWLPAQGATCISYQIRPDGTTTLNPQTRHALTLVMEKDAASETLPPDFRTVLITPLTARTRVY